MCNSDMETTDSNIDKINDKESINHRAIDIFLKIMKLFKPYGDGQIKEKFHKCNLKRDITDIQIYTHICFIYGIYIANENKIYDLFLLLNIMTPLSIMYHINYEKQGLVAKIEGFFAKLLFIYGFIQLFNAKTNILICIECILMISTILVYVITNINKDLYEPYHCLMHIIPAIWAGIVAHHHPCLINLDNIIN